MTYYDLARQLHIAVGTVALVAFWTTALLRKGTPTHKLTGRVYLLAILAVIATALPLAAHAFLTGRPMLGVFLVYLVLITSTAAWLAWRAIRYRASVADYVAGVYRPVAWLNICAGILILVIGVRNAAPVLMGMSAVGLVVGYQMLRFAARPPTQPQWWLKRHYLGIVGSGVATHIAFLNLGLSHLVPLRYAAGITYFSWFGPLLAGLLAVWFLNRRYQRVRAG